MSISKQKSEVGCILSLASFSDCFLFNLNWLSIFLWDRSRILPANPKSLRSRSYTENLDQIAKSKTAASSVKYSQDYLFWIDLKVYCNKSLKCCFLIIFVEKQVNFGVIITITKMFGYHSVIYNITKIARIDLI